MNRVRAFDAGNEVMNIVEEKRPSEFVPFKGEFPLLNFALRDIYYKYIASDKMLDECPIWVQDIVNKGLKIKAIDNNFRKYLKFNGIFKDFKKMANNKKAEELTRFMNANSMTYEYLNI